MFEIYFKGKLIDRLHKFFIKKDNTLFQWLRGVNVEGGENGDIYVDPIYMPLLTVKLEGRILFIDLARKDGNFLTIVLYPRFPFIWIGDGQAEMKEDA